jgi:hypothetical protein
MNLQSLSLFVTLAADDAVKVVSVTVGTNLDSVLR